MNRDLSLSELYYGTNEPVPVARRVTAGRWSALLVDGALRDIRFEGVEIIRSIAYLVRDRDWGTCSPAIDELEVNEGPDSFYVRYRADCENPDGHRIGYTVVMTAHTDRGVAVSASATPSTDFVAARCGFCVLHPIADVAGAPARVEHSDGRIETGHFPREIDPWQPFKDIRTIEHELPSGDQVRCEFKGDVFEMEDQRNWSDASFKTYSRPLELPWPYVLEAGLEFGQSVSVSIRGQATSAAATRHPTVVANRTAASGPVVVDIRPDERQTPELGLAVAPDEIDDVMNHVDALRALGPRRLSLHFDPCAGHDGRTLSRYAVLVKRLRIPATLEYALPGVGEPADEIALLASQIDKSGLELAGLMISPSVHRQSNPPGSISPPCPALDEVYIAARSAFPDLRLSGGMLSYFTEFNRKRPPVALVDEVVHATCPIVHAADDVSVMQTLEAVSHITRSCRELIGDQPYSIGPLTIGMRQNPYGSRTMPNPLGRRIAMADDDPRQRGLFAAAWLTGYVAAVADADLRSLVLGALTGPRGLIDNEGHRYPVFVIASTLAQLGGGPRARCVSGDPAAIAAFAGHREDGTRVVVVANLTPEPREFRLTGDWMRAAGERPALAQGAATDPATGSTTGSATEPEANAAQSLVVDETTFADIRTATAKTSYDLFDDRVRLVRPFGCLVLTG